MNTALTVNRPTLQNIALVALFCCLGGCAHHRAPAGSEPATGPGPAPAPAPVTPANTAPPAGEAPTPAVPAATAPIATAPAAAPSPVPAPQAPASTSVPKPANDARAPAKRNPGAAGAAASSATTAPPPAAPVAAPGSGPLARPGTPDTALDLAGLEQRLRDTHAIGVFTKLSLKNQVDDLLTQFKAFHAGKSKATLSQLRQKYEQLLLKVVSLLQDDDPKLASEVSSSREALWGILTDPKKIANI